MRDGSFNRVGNAPRVDERDRLQCRSTRGALPTRLNEPSHMSLLRQRQLPLAPAPLGESPEEEGRDKQQADEGRADHHLMRSRYSRWNACGPPRARTGRRRGFEASFGN